MLSLMNNILGVNQAIYNQTASTNQIIIHLQLTKSVQAAKKATNKKMVK